jgi:urease beta subunit
MPYPMEQSASSHIHLQVGSTYFIHQLNEEHQFKCGKRTGRVLDIGSGSVLVRWDSYEEVDWEGNKETRSAFNQRIAPQTQVRLLENE